MEIAIKVVAFVLIIAACLYASSWLAAKLTGRDRVTLNAFIHLRRRFREERRRRLTRGERVVAGTLVLLPGPGVVVGIVLLVSNHARPVGIALLILGLLAMAVPIGPILGARVRRREARDSNK